MMMVMLLLLGFLLLLTNNSDGHTTEAHQMDAELKKFSFDGMSLLTEKIE